MPPKAKFTRKQILDGAMEIVKTEGIDALSARSLGKKLGVSSCPIFTAFENMDEVYREVLTCAENLYQSYINEDMKSGKYPPYKASGMAYIRFAKEQTELFKLLFMRNRSGEKIEEKREQLMPILSIIMKNLNISEDEAYIFHIQLWIYVHGVATMIATSYLDWDLNFISDSLTQVYEGLKFKYLSKERQ